MDLFIERGRARRKGFQYQVDRVEQQLFDLNFLPSELLRQFITAMDVYEDLLSKKNKRTTRAIRTWMMIDRRGIIASIDYLVQRKAVPMGFEELGAENYKQSFEFIVLTHQKLFSPSAVQASEARLARFTCD